MSVSIGAASIKGGNTYIGLHIEGQKSDVFHVLHLMLHEQNGVKEAPKATAKPKLDWPPRPLSPHPFAPADINKGIDLPCCDQPEDSIFHTVDISQDSGPGK